MPIPETHPLNPQSPYAATKKFNEIYADVFARTYGFKAIGLRYFNVYGSGEAHKGKFASMIYQLAQQMKSGRQPRIFKHGEQKRVRGVADHAELDDDFEQIVMRVVRAIGAGEQIDMRGEQSERGPPIADAEAEP